MGDDTVKLRDTIRHLLARQSCSFSDKINDLQQLETYIYVYASDTLTAIDTKRNLGRNLSKDISTISNLNTKT